MANTTDHRWWTIAISATTQDWESDTNLWASEAYWGGFADEAQAVAALPDAAADLIHTAGDPDAKWGGEVITWADGSQTVLSVTQVSGDTLTVAGEHIADLGQP
jgi:hypothetical protein